MKILLVYDIAPQSTRDVADGLRDALRMLGHDVNVVPTWAFAKTFYAPFGDSRNVPEEYQALTHGMINKILLGEIALFEPDVVLVVSGWVVALQVTQLVRGRWGIPMALYLTESPYMDAEQVQILGRYDVVFCNELSSMPLMQRHHGNVVYLPHSYNPMIHCTTAGPDPGCDVYFCGTGFTERMELLGAVNWDGIRLKLTGFWPGAERYGIDRYVAGDVVANNDLPPIYSNVPVNLNIHRTTKLWDENRSTEQRIEYAESVGPRVLEVLACGGFLITDYRAEMASMGLHDGEHLVVFADAHDLEEKVRHYLQRGEDRRRIAANGRAAVRGCTFSSRCQQIILPQLEGVTVYG